MSRPMTYPMGTLEVGEVGTMSAANKGDTKRTSRTVEGVTFITRLG